MKIVQPSVELLWITPQAEKMIEIAGRTCYKSEPKVFEDCLKCKGTGKQNLDVEFINDKKEVIRSTEWEFCKVDCSVCSERSSRGFIQKIIKSGHHSVIEHCSASLKLVTDNGIMREITRHRLFSYSIESTRYCNYSSNKFGNEISIIKPSQIIDNSNKYALWIIAMHCAETNYIRLSNDGVSPQIARSILPLCTKCEIVMTGNFRNWRHFLKLRLASNAHPDMILLARKINEVLKKESPTVFDDNY